MNQRTDQQNRAIHKLYADIANHCVANGIDQKTTINTFQNFETPVTPEFVKETWRVIQTNMFGKKSTTELTTTELDRVYDVFNKFWSEVTGEHFPFPSLEAMYWEASGDSVTATQLPPRK